MLKETALTVLVWAVTARWETSPEPRLVLVGGPCDPSNAMGASGHTGSTASPGELKLLGGITQNAVGEGQPNSH